MKIIQGDQHPIAFTLADGSGQAIATNRISSITACLAGLTKTATWDAVTSRWSFPLTAAETAAIPRGDYCLKLRIAFTSGDIRNIKAEVIHVRGGE